jgi:protein TonB
MTLRMARQKGLSPQADVVPLEDVAEVVPPEEWLPEEVPPEVVPPEEVPPPEVAPPEEVPPPEVPA